MTLREADECMEALADIISIDCTDTPRGDACRRHAEVCGGAADGTGKSRQ